MWEVHKHKFRHTYKYNSALSCYFCHLLIIFASSWKPDQCPTKRQAWSGSKLFNTLNMSLKEIFKKVNFEKSHQRTKKQACKELTITFTICSPCWTYNMCGSRGGRQEVETPLGNSQKYSVFSNTRSGSPGNHKGTKQAFNFWLWSAR